MPPPFVSQGRNAYSISQVTKELGYLTWQEAYTCLSDNRLPDSLRANYAHLIVSKSPSFVVYKPYLELVGCRLQVYISLPQSSALLSAALVSFLHQMQKMLFCDGGKGTLILILVLIPSGFRFVHWCWPQSVDSRPTQPVLRVRWTGPWSRIHEETHWECEYLPTLES